MDRLTTNNPKGSLKTAYNLFYIKGKETWVVGGGPKPDYKDISLYDFIRKIIKDYGLNIGAEKNDDMGENLYERLSDGSDTAEGIVALLYTAAWAFSEIREKLKAYEDTGLEPEEIPQWIPVSERLPEESKYRDKTTGELIPLLVCVKGTEYPFRAMYDGKSWGDGIEKLDVVCWMPLPQAPKREKP